MMISDLLNALRPLRLFCLKFIMNYTYYSKKDYFYSAKFVLITGQTNETCCFSYFL